MPPSSPLISRFDTVLRDATAGGHHFRLLAVRDTNTLLDAIDPHIFAADERFPYWADLWASSVALAEYLTEMPAGKTVLELGCGLGLAGIAAARAGASVTMTDIDTDALAFAAENVRLNLKPEEQSRVSIAAMDWRNPTAEGPFDLVIGADIVYERRFFAPLLSLFTRLLAPGGSVLLADPDRAIGRDFLAMARSVGWRETTTRKRLVWNGTPVTVTIFSLTLTDADSSRER